VFPRLEIEAFGNENVSMFKYSNEGDEVVYTYEGQTCLYVRPNKLVPNKAAFSYFLKEKYFFPILKSAVDPTQRFVSNRWAC